MHELLDRPVLEADLQEKLLERAGGNPLYAEEFARLVGDRNAMEELPLPETVQGVIAARIDALPPGEKTLLQDAAVLGKVFSLGAAAELGEVERWEAEQRLHALERKEFVRRERRASVTGEVEYAFSHVLVGDVATARSHEACEPKSIVSRPGGSRRSGGPRITPSSSPITTSRRSSSPRQRVVRPTV